MDNTKHLKALDYIIVITLMIIPLGIGVYFAYKQRKGTTMANYLLADRKVKSMAIAMSAFSTMASATTIVGIPAEIYMYGSQMMMFNFPQLLVYPLYTHVFVPIFISLNSCSMYTYFELRYNKILWKFCALAGVIEMLIVTSAIIVASSSVFVRATGIGMWTSSILVVIICVTYTSIGGMKAVIWTDFFQGLLILVTVALILIVGTNYAGGFFNIWNTSLEGQRLQIFDFDTTQRHTFYTSIFGSFMSIVCYQIGNQATVQRFLTAPNVKTAQKAIIVGLTIKHVTMFIVWYIALIVYTSFNKCDPVTGLGLPPNQLVSMFIMNAFAPFPGFSGIFIAGLLAALLSTMSSFLNALSAVTVQDLCGTYLERTSEKNKVLLCKILVFVYGVASLMGIYVIHLFQNVFQAIIVLQAVIATSAITLILVGVFLPQVNTKAAMIADAFAIALSLWIAIGNLLYGRKSPTKPMNTSECFANSTLWTNGTNGSFQETSYTSMLNVTLQETTNVEQYSSFQAVYNISNMWLSGITYVSILILCYVLTQLMGPEPKSKLRMDLIPPAVQYLHLTIPKKMRRIFLCDVYDDDKTNTYKNPEEIIMTKNENVNDEEMISLKQ